MKRKSLATVASLALTVGIIGAATATAAPAQADPVDDFLVALGNAGVDVVNPATAVAVGQTVCPMLAQPGQNVADVAARVADAAGMPLGPATMFTGVAISTFCPSVVSSLGNGVPPLPLPIPGL
jgi:hypothetical protein